MNFLENILSEKGNAFIDLTEQHYSEENQVVSLFIQRLASFYTLAAAARIHSSPMYLSFLNAAAELHLPGSVDEVNVFFDQGSGTDAFLDRGNRILDWLLGEHIPAVIQRMKSAVPMRPSSVQQIAKLFAAFYYGQLAEKMRMEASDPEDGLAVLSANATIAERMSDDIVRQWLEAADLRDNDLQDSESVKVPLLHHRILPWVLLAFAALILLYILNKGCAPAGPDKETGDAIIHEMRI